MSDTETRAEPTPGPWWPNETSGHIHADWCLVAEVGDFSGEGYLSDTIERWEADKRLIAAAGTAAHELPDEYDPVEVQKNLPKIVGALQANHDSGHTDTCDKVLIGDPCTCGWQEAHDALSKARGDDA